MRKFGLIGYPLGHSFSKQYFSEKFHYERIADCSYENYPLEDINLLKPLLTAEPDLCGLNVTIPYKSEVMGLLDRISAEAEDIGAVNVIRIKRSGEKTELYGFNSDIAGIKDTLIPLLNDKMSNAIVLGTGGSSRAVCYVLKKLGLNVILVSRSRKPGAVSYKDLDSPVLKSAALIVNTTPLGMFPDVHTMPDIDYNQLDRGQILFDLVYNPEMTAFLKRGSDRGCITVGGIKMLHSQAEKAWKIWNDPDL